MAVATHYNARPPGRGRTQNFWARFFSGIFPVKGDSAGEVIRKLIFIIALGSFIYFGGPVVYKLTNEFFQDIKTRQYNRTRTMETDPIIAGRVKRSVPEILPEFIHGYDLNNDLIGHIKIDDRSKPGEYIIDYPVFQSDDNFYYLNRAMDHSISAGGAVFADWRNLFMPAANGLSANTILYGHNIITGAYFAKLTRYYSMPNDNEDKALEFYKNHPVISFDTIYERSMWKVFACVLFNTQESLGEIYDYNNKIDFYTEEEFNTFILDIMDRSVLFADVDIEYGDNILTLSTCYYPMGESVDTRCVVFARKLRDGENPGVNTNKAVINKRELRFEEQARRFGSNWNGRVWDTTYLKSYNG